MAHDPCGAHRANGEPCTRPAGWGTDHVGFGRCKLHGGSTPTQIKGARKLQVAAMAVEFGLPREVDPATAVLEAVHKAAGQVDWYETEVRALNSPWVEQTVPGGTRIDAHPAVTGYTKALDQLYTFSERVMKLDLFSRQVQADELQAAMLARLVMEILDSPELGLSHEQREQGRRIGGRKLRELASPKAG